MENNGPPKSATCWPVTTAEAPARKRAMLSSVSCDAPQARFCRSRMAATRSRRAAS